VPKLVPIEPELEEPEPETRPVFTPREIIRLNRKHAVIANLGGKCVIMEFVPSNVTPGTEEPSYQTFKSFRERYLNQYVRDEISDKKISIGQFWLAHPRRRQYEGLDLVPDGPSVLPGNIFNLWRRWGVEAKKGDWSLLRKHVYEVLANGDRKFDDYIIRWGAWTFQHPGERTGAALVLRGGKGSGKGVWGDVFMTIFGEHGLQIFDPAHLTGKHNAHLQNKLFLFADEAFWAGDKTAERTLKGVVTEKRMMIEPKGINAFPWPNRMSLHGREREMGCSSKPRRTPLCSRQCQRTLEKELELLRPCTRRDRSRRTGRNALRFATNETRRLGPNEQHPTNPSAP